MVADIWKVAKTLVTLADDLQRYHAEIKEIRRDLLNLTLVVQRLSDEITILRQHEESEREKMELRLKIWQLEFEKKQLPLSEGEGER